MPSAWPGSPSGCWPGWVSGGEAVIRTPRGASTSNPLPRHARGGWIRSFVFAGRGLGLVWRTERNFRVQAAVGWGTLALGWTLRLPAARLAVLVLVAAVVLAAEAMNTALEVAVDLVVKTPHPLAGAAKDLAAGAVLCTSFGALGVGVVLLGPWLFTPARLWFALAAHPVSALVGVVVLGLLVRAATLPLEGRRIA